TWSLLDTTAQSVHRTFDTALPFSAPPSGGGGLSPQLATTVARLPEVAQATGVGKGVALVGGSAEAVSVADVPALARVLHLDVAAGSLDRLRDGQLAVSSDLAGKRGWHVGSVVTVGFADGTGRD